MPAAKIYRPVSLLFIVAEIFERFLNSKMFDDLENCDLFLIDFQYSFRSSCQNSTLLTVVVGRIARAFSMSGAIQDVARNIC